MHIAMLFYGSPLRARHTIIKVKAANRKHQGLFCSSKLVSSDNRCLTVHTRR